MKRRLMLQCTLAALASGQTGRALAQEVLAPTAPHPLTPAWEAWKAVYMEADGRVIDQLQQGASHSESQGYGLLLAATMRDAAAFDAIDAWTMQNLAIRSDALFAWRWFPVRGDEVPDRNNASDGDLFYAWALVRAAGTLNRPELIGRATVIARDLIGACVRPHPDGSGRLVFTPAAAGFQRETGLVMNPSYLMPLAMREVARATGLDTLRVCASDGLTILTDLTNLGLVPDWVELRQGGPAPAEGMSFQNGYDAIRAPLFLIWSGAANHQAVQRQARAYRDAGTDARGTPTVMERQTARVLEQSPDAGYAATAGLVACATAAGAGSAIPFFSPDQPYYPATLHLFALLAQIETIPQCVPL